MHLNCPDCNSSIKVDDVDLVKTIAKCKDCHNIFQFNKELHQGGQLVSLDDATEKHEIFEIPPGIEFLKLMSELEIRVRWSKVSKFHLPFAAISGNAIIYVVIFFLMSWKSLGILLFLPVILLGFYMLYLSLGYLLNSTYINVDEKKISIQHRPLGFMLKKDLFIVPEDIDQFFVKRYQINKGGDHPIFAFSLNIKFTNGKTYQLLKGLNSEKRGQFIEQEIERFLGIKDKGVRGEWPKV